jgi:hypothetical protein
MVYLPACRREVSERLDALAAALCTETVMAAPGPNSVLPDAPSPGRVSWEECPGWSVLGRVSWEECLGKSVLGGVSWEECPRNSLLLGAVCSWEGSPRKGVLLGRAT